MKTELSFLFILFASIFSFNLDINSETNIELDNNCYFKSNKITEIYNVRENDTLTNEISIKNKNIVMFYEEDYDIPKTEKEEEKQESKNIKEEEEKQEAAKEVPQNIQVKQEVIEKPVVESPKPKVVETPAANSDLANAVVNYAIQFVGNPYVYGGTSLTSGTDCSGFTQSVFSNFGISLPRTSSGQASAGSYVSLENIQTGDLVFYGYSGRISHVGLYIGNGQVVHALNPSQGIGITTYTLMPIITVRRVL